MRAMLSIQTQVVEQIFMTLQHSKKTTSRKNMRNKKISNGWNYDFTRDHHRDLSESFGKDAFKSLVGENFTPPSETEERKLFIAFLLHVCSTIKIYNILLLNIMMIRKKNLLFYVSIIPLTYLIFPPARTSF